MSKSRRRVEVVISRMGLLACGAPKTLNVSSSVVHDGTNGVYEFTLVEGAKKYARDGTFNVVYTIAAGTTRCRGDAVVSAKDQRHDGEFHVEMTFAPPCSRVKTTNETTATYTFAPSKGATLAAPSAGSSTDLTTWDEAHLTEGRLAGEARAAEPIVAAEIKRFAPLAALVPTPSGRLTKCPAVVAAQLEVAPPARLSYDDLLRFASSSSPSGGERLDFASEGVHSAMATSTKDPSHAANDARMTRFVAPAYAEVFRVSAFAPWRIITAGDEPGTYDPAAPSGDITVIDIAKGAVVCGGPIAVHTDSVVLGNGHPDDSRVKDSLARNYRAARSALEEKLVGALVPPTP